MNPQIGRFISMDSYEGVNEQPISLHKYLYSNSDPVNGIDPSGNFTIQEVVQVANFIGFVSSRSYAVEQLFDKNKV